MKLDTLLTIEQFLPEITQSHSGMYEARITVSVSTPAMSARFRALCRELGVHCATDGRLGTHPASVTIHHGGIEQVHGQVRTVAERISRSGFTVTSIHIYTPRRETPDKFSNVPHV